MIVLPVIVAENTRRASYENSVKEAGMLADHLEKTTGKRPDSWEEYKSKQPLSRSSGIKSFVISALIGAAVVGLGAGIAAMAGVAVAAANAAALAALVAGAAGFIGAISANETNRMAEAQLLGKYNAYLDGFEESVSQSHAKECCDAQREVETQLTPAKFLTRGKSSSMTR